MSGTGKREAGSGEGGPGSGPGGPAGPEAPEQEGPREDSPPPRPDPGRNPEERSGPRRSRGPWLLLALLAWVPLARATTWEALAGVRFTLAPVTGALPPGVGAGEVRGWARSVLADHWISPRESAPASLHLQVSGGALELDLRTPERSLWKGRETLSPGVAGRALRPPVERLLTRFSMDLLRSNPGLVRRRPSLTLPENPGVQPEAPPLDLLVRPPNSFQRR